MELRRLGQALAQLIHAKSVVRSAAASVGWPIGGALMKALQPNVHGRENIPLGSLNRRFGTARHGLGVGPDRFMMGDRRWMPRWRFQPSDNLMDAFQLLDGARQMNTACRAGNGLGFQVRVRIGEVIGEAHGISKPLAITHAVARAVGIEVKP